MNKRSRFALGFRREKKIESSCYRRRLLVEGLESRQVFAAFTPGNLAIYRVGNGVEDLVSTGNNVAIDEYTIGGDFVQSIDLPSYGLNSLVASGIGTFEGKINRSADGNYLVFAGYGPEAIPYPQNLSTTSASDVNRIVGRIDANGTVDTSTRLNNFGSNSSPRSVASTNGVDFWIGSGSTAASIMKTTLGANGGSATSLGVIQPSIQAVGIYNGQLYVTSTQGNAPNIRVGSVGSGLPITGGQSIVNLPGISSTVLTSPHSFFMANLETSNPNLDTLYVADSGTGLRKFSLVAGTWVLNGTIGDGTDAYRGLTGVVSGNHVGLFATRRAGSTVNGGGELVSIFDASGHNGNLTAAPTLLATADPKKVFRGVALAPGNPTQSVVAIAAVDKAKMEGDGGGSTTFNFTISRIGTTTSAINVDWNVTGMGSNPAQASDFAGGFYQTGHFILQRTNFLKQLPFKSLPILPMNPTKFFPSHSRMHLVGRSSARQQRNRRS